MIHRWAGRIAGYLETELSFDQANHEVLAYGLEAILGIFIKLVVFFIVPLLFGIGPPTWMAFGVALLFRLSAGGAHCHTYACCLVSSLITFLGIGAVSSVVAGDSLFLRMVWMGSMVVAGVVVLVWVPADSAARPVESNREKQHKKLWAASTLVVYVLLYFG